MIFQFICVFFDNFLKKNLRGAGQSYGLLWAHTALVTCGPYQSFILVTVVLKSNLTELWAHYWDQVIWVRGVTCRLKYRNSGVVRSVTSSGRDQDQSIKKTGEIRRSLFRYQEGGSTGDQVSQKIVLLWRSLLRYQEGGSKGDQVRTKDRVTLEITFEVSRGGSKRDQTSNKFHKKKQWGMRNNHTQPTRNKRHRKFSNASSEKLNFEWEW